MNGITTSIIAGAIWDLIKAGGKFTKDILKRKLSTWLIDEDIINQIVDSVNKAPDFCLESKEQLKSYLDLNRTLVENLNRLNLNQTNPSTHQEINNNSGVAVENIGNNNSICVNQYSREEPPRTADREVFSVIEDYIQFKKIQIVKSFSLSRPIAQVEKDMDGDLFVISSLSVPPLQDGFFMTLFSYIPSENWSHFAERGYHMEFFLNAPDNIHSVQLQVKNAEQKQFIDLPLNLENHQFHFNQKLTALCDSRAWKNIGEICFTVFLEDNDLSGRDISYKISKFNLVQ